MALSLRSRQSTPKHEIFLGEKGKRDDDRQRHQPADIRGISAFNCDFDNLVVDGEQSDPHQYIPDDAFR